MDTAEVVAKLRDGCPERGGYRCGDGRHGRDLLVTGSGQRQGEGHRQGEDGEGQGAHGRDSTTPNPAGPPRSTSSATGPAPKGRRGGGSTLRANCPTQAAQSDPTTELSQAYRARPGARLASCRHRPVQDARSPGGPCLFRSDASTCSSACWLCWSCASSLSARCTRSVMTAQHCTNATRRTSAVLWTRSPFGSRKACRTSSMTWPLALGWSRARTTKPSAWRSSRP